MSNTGQRYRFGPLERRGLIGSLRVPQVVAIALGLTGAVVLMRTLSGGAGIFSALALALGAIVFCFWPIAGRSAEEWLPVVTRHTARRARGQHRFVSGAPQAGVRPGNDGRPAPIVGLPDPTRHLELLAAPFQGEQVGVIKDRKTRTYTVALAVRVTSFGLLDRAEQEGRQAGWGGVLAGLAREGSPVSRIQWIERTVPAHGDEIGRYLGEAWIGSRRRSTRCRCSPTSISQAPRPRSRPITSSSSASKSMRSGRGGRSNAPEASKAPSRRVRCAAARVGGARRAIGRCGRPGRGCAPPRRAVLGIPGGIRSWSRPGLARLAAADPERDGIDEAAAWPTATENSWGIYRTESAFHATYWISGWPRIDVGAAFLSPLLLHAQMVRAIGVTIEPISPVKAIREVEAARTSDIADRDLRGRMGFIETARGRRQTDAVARREEELADGHAALRFAGYVTVSARSLEGLERHCSEIEHAAQMARLELLRLYGQQEEAFTYTLPLCRGLR